MQDTKVYEFIKHLQKVSDKTMQAIKPLNKQQPGITRKYSDPKYDNDDYMQNLESQLMKQLNITPSPEVKEKSPGR